jgi:hypothetical protein
MTWPEGTRYEGAHCKQIILRHQTMSALETNAHAVTLSFFRALV